MARASEAPPGGSPVDPELAALAEALVAIGRRVRDAVRAARHAAADGLGAVVRAEGGDHIFGVDAVADRIIVDAIGSLGARWPGTWVMEGFDDALAVGPPAADGSPGGPWRYLCDPLDGTRPLLVDKRSAWVLIGAGRSAATLEELELSVVVEVPTRRAAVGLVAWADRAGNLVAVDEDLSDATVRAVTLRPRPDAELEHSFVTVVRFAPGHGAVIGRWADEHLAGLTTFDDLVPCSAGQLMGLASGADAAVFDPRPLLAPGTMAAHPYDLAGLWVARAAGAVIEALPAGPLDVPLSVEHPVAWAGYANEAVASRLRVHALPLWVSSQPEPAA